MIRLMIVARQAGSMAAFAPLFDLHDGPITLVVYPTALRPLVEAGRSPDHVVERFDPTVAERAPVDAILTGTSFEGDDDAHWWSWGRGRGVPATAFVDQPANYRARFPKLGDHDAADATPDRIALGDPVMRLPLEALGASRDRIYVTGHPAYDVLHEAGGARRVKARRRLGVKDDRPVVLWVGEPPPLSRSIEDDKALRGYTESETVHAAFTAVREATPDAFFIVRPHPVHAERGGAPAPPVSQNVRIEEGPRVDALAAADLVIGQTSILLYEAHLLGLPVISFQPRRRVEGSFLDDLPGLRLVVDPDPAALIDAVEEAFARARGPCLLPDKGVAARALLDLAIAAP